LIVRFLGVEGGSGGSGEGEGGEREVEGWEDVGGELE